MSRAGGAIARPPVETRSVVEPTLWRRIAFALLRLALTVAQEILGWTVRYPLSMAALVGVVWIYATAGQRALIGTLAGLVAVTALWAWWSRTSFEAFLGVTWRSRWRGWWVYARRWDAVWSMCGLHSSFTGTEHVPTLRRVRSDSTSDRVLVGLCFGVTPTTIGEKAEELACAFGAQRCEVVADRPGRVWLVFTRRDRLADTVPALPMPTVSDLAALPVGARQDVMAYPKRREVFRSVVDRLVDPNGSVAVVLRWLRLAGATGAGDLVWTLRLLGSHVLIAGATGAGKGSVLWSLIRALVPGVRAGVVQLWVIDPKGGMELAFGAPLFHRFCYGAQPDEADDGKRRAFEIGFAECLEDLVTEMRARQERLRGRVRQHAPTIGDPAIVLFVDEYASLTAYVRDRDAKNRIADAMNLLLSQGRAVNVLVVAAVQDPRKETVPNRGLFPTRIALRLSEEAETDLILGRAARLRGAACHDIPHATPGVGYVVLDGVRDPVRVRAGHVTDADIEAMILDPVGPDTGEIPAYQENTADGRVW